ncbi:MAG: RNA polymerase sigma factor [Bacteroidota bacterium]
MHAINPLSATYDPSQDQPLVEDALKGNSKSLNELVKKHHQFLYNIALRMMGNVPDAEDLTQEILIRMITNLSRYDASKAQFRTWLYHMAVRLILNHKRSKQEQMIQGFDQFFGFVEHIPDDPSPALSNDQELQQEVQIKCMNGMLMCLAREDRLLYVLGDLFNIDHNLGATLFKVSKANFRQKLSRTRKQLRQWMDNKCGLVNKANPCRCRKKTKGFIERGIVDPQHLLWNKEFTEKIEAYSRSNLDDLLLGSDRIYSKIYQKQPFKTSQQADELVSSLLDDDHIADFLSL